MQPEKRNLLDDLLNEPGAEARRDAVLQAGGKIMRRRRAFRFAARTLALVGVGVVAALMMQHKPAPPAVALAKQDKPGKSVATSEQVQYLTDDQLLALFHDVPVGLIKLPDGKKRLVFLRPGDEAKYITRL